MDDPSFDEWSEKVYDPNGPKLHIWVSGRRNIIYLYHRESRSTAYNFISHNTSQ